MSDEAAPVADDDPRLWHDHDWLRFYHLKGKEQRVTIESVERGQVTNEGGKRTNKPVLRFKGVKLPFAISKTDTKTLGTMFGYSAKNWVGRAVTLYPTTTRLAGKVVDCIRVRLEVRGDAEE